MVDFDRYQRQIVLSEIGFHGQERLAKASVLVVGLGGLGCPVASYLSACGIGHLGLCDADVVSYSNLHRQVLYGNHDVGKSKVEIASQKLRLQNPDLRVSEYFKHISKENINRIANNFDVIVDCVDNLNIKYVLNDYSVEKRKALIFGAVEQFEGRVATFGLPHTPCLRCLFINEPNNCDIKSCNEIGVLGPMPAFVASAQSLQTIHVLLGSGNILSGKMLIIDGKTFDFVKLSFESQPSCFVCSKVKEGNYSEIGRMSRFGAYFCSGS